MLSHFTGALVGDRVRCPFHGACFNIKTGDIEEYPGLDCLPSYKVLTCFILIMQFNNWGTITVNQWILCLECVDSVTYTNSSLFSKVKVEDGKVYVSVNKKVSKNAWFSQHSLSFLNVHVAYWVHLVCRWTLWLEYQWSPQSLKVYKRVKDMSCRVSGVRHTILLIGGGEDWAWNVRKKGEASSGSGDLKTKWCVCVCRTCLFAVCRDSATEPLRR